MWGHNYVLWALFVRSNRQHSCQTIQTRFCIAVDLMRFTVFASSGDQSVFSMTGTFRQSLYAQRRKLEFKRSTRDVQWHNTRCRRSSSISMHANGFLVIVSLVFKIISRLRTVNQQQSSLVQWTPAYCPADCHSTQLKLDNSTAHL